MKLLCLSNTRMDIFEKRRAKLLQLIEEDFSGNQAEFCRKTGIGAPQLNRWVSTTNVDTRNISERSARSIEQKCNKPFDWLDMDDSAMRDQSMLNIFRKLSKYDQESIMLQAIALSERASLIDEQQSISAARKIAQ